MNIPIRSGSQRGLRGAGLSLLLILLLAGLAACGSTPASSSAQTSSSSSGKQTVTIGYMDNGAEPEVIAVAKKLFQQRMNANVQVKYFDSGPASLGAVASGSVQIMTGIGNPPTVSAISRGVPLQVVWAQELYTGGEGLVVRGDSGITSLQDLKGKTVAVVLGSTSEFALDTLLTKAGISPSSIHKLNMAPPAMRAAWNNRSIDAAYVWNPVLDALRQQNGKVLATDENIKQDAPIYSLSLVNTQWASNNKELVKSFIQAQNDAVTLYKEHPDEALQIIAKYESISVDLVKTELAGLQIFSLQDQLTTDALGESNNIASSLVTKSLTTAATYLKAKGSVTSVPDHLEQNVNPTFVEELLKESK
jgi:NitT/TauT family transport system substrate-binding protein/taurine transport system substrate-binding protein